VSRTCAAACILFLPQSRIVLSYALNAYPNVDFPDPAGPQISVTVPLASPLTLCVRPGGPLLPRRASSRFNPIGTDRGPLVLRLFSACVAETVGRRSRYREYLRWSCPQQRSYGRMKVNLGQWMTAGIVMSREQPLLL